MTLDSFINAVIPWIIGIGGIYIMYKPLKEPLSGLFGSIGSFIKSLILMIRGDEEEDLEISNTDFKIQNIDYE